MSAKSSNNAHRHLGRVARASHTLPVSKKTKRKYDWRMLLGLPLWVLTAFFASQFIVLGILLLLNWLHVSPENYMSEAVSQTLIAALVYAFTLAIVIGVPYAVRRVKTPLSELGLQRLPSWTDIGLAPLAFIAYGLLTTIILSVITANIAGFPADQAQETGFSAFGSRLDNMLAFVTLVVLAPLAEEVVFRGYLYGKLKKYVPVIVAAIATSVLFGIVHMQWNVGIDVFVLSLVLCGLRSLTGSIWAGVLVHMIKNAIAYYILFVSPLMGG